MRCAFVTSLHFNTNMHQETDSLLMGIKSEIPNISIISQIDSEIEKEALLNSVNLSIMCISLFIFTMCMFIYINIIKSQYIKQNQLWGIVRAMGVKKNTIIKHILETLIIFLLAIMINSLLINVVNFLPIREDLPSFSHQLLVVYFSSIIIALIGTLPIVLNIFNKNIIEQIEYIE